MTKNIFGKFFEDYSKNVDNANSQFFWKLSDDIIFEVIKKYLKKPLPKDFVILDAGGGTGRWIQMISKKFKSKFILYDMSSSMLAIAQKKPDLKKIGTRLKIIQGDIQNMQAIKNSSVNFVISIYNPISFVKEPIRFFKEVKRVLKKRGVALVMGQGLPNAIASKINNYLADSRELNFLDKNQRVKWNQSLAPLKVFSSNSFEKLTSKAKLNTINIYGIPIFLQPGPEDFDSKNKLKSRVSSKLNNDPEFYKTVFELEMKYNSNEFFVNRGMNLLIVVQKL